MLPYLLAIAGGYLIGNSINETPQFDEGGELDEKMQKIKKALDSKDITKIPKSAVKALQNKYKDLLKEKHKLKGREPKSKDSRGEFGTFVYEIYSNDILKEEKIVRAGYSNLVKELALAEATKYDDAYVRVRKLSDKEYEAGGGIDERYKVVVWETEEDRDMGESIVISILDDKEYAIDRAKHLYRKFGHAAVEVIDSNDELVFHISDDEDADGGVMAKGGEIKIYSEVEWKGKSPKTNQIETFKGKVIAISSKNAEIKYTYDGKFFKTKKPLEDLKLIS